MRSMTRTAVGVAVVVLLSWSSGAAHDFELNRDQKRELKQAAELLRAYPELDIEKLHEVRRILRSFKPAELEHLNHCAEFKQLQEVPRNVLGHAARAIAFGRTHEPNLSSPWEIALRMGSASTRDWMAGIRLLRRRPFDANLEKVVVALATDPRPEVRLSAVRLAKLLVVFRGPSPTCVAIAKRLVVDPMPNVAAFSIPEAIEIGDLELVDLLVSRLRDTRPLVRGTSETLRGGGKVGTSCRNRLSHEFFGWSPHHRGGQ